MICKNFSSDSLKNLNHFTAVYRFFYTFALRNNRPTYVWTFSNWLAISSIYEKDNAHALNLYKRKGFTESGAVYDDEIELSLMMQ